MNNLKVIIPVVILSFGLGIGLVFKDKIISAFQGSSSDPDAEAVEITWKELRKLDHETGEAPEELLEKIKSPIKIAGFGVSLSPQVSSIDEFLFVPTQGACVHVPAPPPNLVIYAKTKEQVDMELLQGPMWIEGRIRIENSESELAKSGYAMQVTHVKEYTYEE